MPETLNLHLPSYRDPNLPKLTPSQHTIIPLQVPLLTQPRAAYFHDLLHQLWTHGIADFKPADIFNVPARYLIAIDLWDGIQKHHQNQHTNNNPPQLLTGGNIHQPSTHPAYAGTKISQLAAAARHRIHTLQNIETYIALPRNEALKRTRDYQTAWFSLKTTISEAEYLLREPTIHLEFEDHAKIWAEADTYHNQHGTYPKG